MLYLQTVAAFGLLPHHVEDAVHQLGALGVVPLGPVVAGPGLPEHEVVGAEDAAVRAGPDDILFYLSLTTQHVKRCLAILIPYVLPAKIFADRWFKGLIEIHHSNTCLIATLPHLTLSMVPGSRSTSTALGTNLPPDTSLSPLAFCSGDSPIVSL